MGLIGFFLGWTVAVTVLAVPCALIQIIILNSEIRK